MGFNIDARIYWEERNRIKSCESKRGRGKIKNAKFFYDKDFAGDQ